MSIKNAVWVTLTKTQYLSKIGENTVLFSVFAFNLNKKSHDLEINLKTTETLFNTT